MISFGHIGMHYTPIEQPTVSLHDQQEYPEFAFDMEYWGYTWDAHKIKTDDGFVLTTFHITGKKGH